MSIFTFSDLSWISRSDLASMLRNETPGVSIIDVRDSDYIGGHIKGSQNVPTQTHDHKMPELIRTLRDQDTIIFHCSLSQCRKCSCWTAGSAGGSRRRFCSYFSFIMTYALTVSRISYGQDEKLTEGYVKELWE